MLLSPWHLLQQDAATAIAATWHLRHLRAESGLVGPGLRRAADRGHPAFDPQLSVRDDGTTVQLALSWARAITPDGTPVEVRQDAPVRVSFPRSELTNTGSVLVHAVLLETDEEDAKSVGIDQSNPTMPAFRRQGVALRIDLPADLASRAVVVGKLRRATNTESFEVDPGFIPASASMIAHSVLYSGWTRVQAAVAILAGEYSEMHRIVARFVDELSRRGIDVRADLDTLSFVERSVLALDACAYETIDPSAAPGQFFSAIERTSRRVALALDLSPATRSFFQILAGTDASYSALLEEERALLAGQRALSAYDDLARAMDRGERSLASLRQLLDALSGKYIDYRVNRAVESLRFLLDRSGDEFYAAVATPAHPQRDGELLTFVFSELGLPARHEYRVVLVGDRGAADFTVGDEFSITVRVNSTMGPGRAMTRKVTCELPQQRNFAMNFEPPLEVATIAGLEVTVNPGTRIRGCVLFQRRRGVQVGTAAGGSNVGGGYGGPPPPPPQSGPPPTPPPPTRGVPGAPPKIVIKKPGQH
jgi:hypothetical protein